jgi:hypothetical protein
MVESSVLVIGYFGNVRFDQMHWLRGSFIHTPLQRGDDGQRDARNRFNGFPAVSETVETVRSFPPA